ncbi:MAG: squalene/phytoene synthase family protein [Hyphomicrobiales bacterium]|nr:squalene/phytoene synthase family protein [Hyphomicrobiales bacterium]
MSARSEEIAAGLRRDDPEAWAISLYAPAALRAHVQVLAAFAHELRQISTRVSQPLAGEMRLQWWRDVLEKPGSGDGVSPLAEALLASVQQLRLPVAALVAMIDAHAHDLYGEAFADEAALESYCGASDAALLRLTTLVLAQGGDPGGAGICGHAGMAAGILRVAGRFGPAMLENIEAPLQLAQVHLRAAEAGIATLDPAARPALVGLGLVKARLRKWQRGRGVEISPLARLAQLWLYARRLP